jgi:hypothetical protein
MSPDDLLLRYATTETSLWVADRHGKNRRGEMWSFPSLPAAINEVSKLPADKVVVDLVVHEPGYDRTVTAEEIATLSKKWRESLKLIRTN